MSKKVLSCFVALALLAPTFTIQAEEREIQEFYVSAALGDDNNDGSRENPFKTVEKAKNVVAAAEKDKPIVVNIEAGTYCFENSLVIDESGSGSLDNPVTYRAYGGEVIFSGGKKLPFESFVQISDEVMIERLPDDAKENVLQVNLADVGDFDVSDEPAIRGIVGSLKQREGAELFIDDEYIRLARWPDFGFAQAGYCSENVANVTEEIFIKNIDDRQLSWLNADGVMIETHGQIEGFSSANYRTAGAKLLGVDSETGYMISGMQRDTSCAFYSDMRYYVFNIAEELDAPGEYYIDRENAVLYFYPTENFESNNRIVISQFDSDILKITNASYINFEGISFKDTRENCISMTNCSDIIISDYEVCNAGRNGVILSDCKNVVFDNGKIYNIARCGFDISETINDELIESGNVLKNSDVYKCSRASSGTVSAISLTGVGNKISNCKIHDCPSSAVGMSGLKHVIEDSEFYNFCEYISDWGVIYIGRSWAYYGNIIRNNYFHDIDNYQVNAVYLDDYMSGATVEGNAFVNCYSGIAVSGGRDNTVINNFFYNCEKSLGLSTHWGVEDDKYHAKDGTDNNNVYYRLINSPYLKKLKEEFYGVKRILDEYDSEEYPDNHPEYPKYNTVYGNVVYSSPKVSVDENVVKYGDINITVSKDVAIFKR